MTATILDGRAIAAQVKAQVAERAMALVDRGIQPGLAAVLVVTTRPPDLPRAKHKACSEVGMRSEQVDLPAFVTEGELLATIRRLNRDPEIHGIIVQLPLPKHISELAVQTTMDPRKDVDGLHPLNVGLMVRGEPSFPRRPRTGSSSSCSARGRARGRRDRGGGLRRSGGAPLSILLAQDWIRGNATVTVCHIKTRDLAEHTRRADILVAATGDRSSSPPTWSNRARSWSTWACTGPSTGSSATWRSRR